jgi:hypothetical protein
MNKYDTGFNYARTAPPYWSSMGQCGVDVRRELRRFLAR